MISNNKYKVKVDINKKWKNLMDVHIILENVKLKPHAAKNFIVAVYAVIIYLTLLIRRWII